MHPMSRASRDLLRTRLAVGVCVAGVAGGLAGGALPLVEVPGFDLGLAAALATALLIGPALGIAAARRELAAAGAAAPSVLRPFAAAALALALALLALAGTAALRAAATTPCRALAGGALFAVVAGPSALLSAALGVGCGLVLRGRRLKAALVYALIAAATLSATALDAYRGPAASAFDHLFGAWPGPLYDEAIELDRHLLLFRAETVAWTGVALAAAALLARRRHGAPRRWPAAALLASLAAALVARDAGGGPISRSDLSRALGGVRSGRRCLVHLPREKPPWEADRILRDCEYDAEAVTRALGLAHAPRAVVWVYRSPEEKRALVGAGRTSFTKPWLAEIHVNDEGTPHPVLRHELVHALASAAATGPLRVPARAGVLVNAGLIEGLAEAVDVPASPYSVHQWARALRDQGHLPPLSSLLGWSGFFSAAPARAYTAAGSFLRHLIDRHGTAAAQAAYRQGDVARALGRPHPQLEAEWHRVRDGVRGPPSLAALAEARFERGSLFARACVREVGQLELDAARAAADRRAVSAESLLRRASALSGGDPTWLRAAAEAWRSAGDLARSEAIAAEGLAAAEAAGGHLALRASLLGLLGDLRFRAGDPAAAAERYRAALALGVEGGGGRALRAKLAAAADPRLADAVAPWLLGVGDPALALARLARADHPLARYLLGRALLARGAPSHALDELTRLSPCLAITDSVPGQSGGSPEELRSTSTGGTEHRDQRTGGEAEVPPAPRSDRRPPPLPRQALHRRRLPDDEGRHPSALGPRGDEEALDRSAEASPTGLARSPLLAPELARECRRMTAEALCLAGRWRDGIAAFTALARESAAAEDGARAAAQDAARRCAFERDEYGSPVAWEGDWPRRR
jgi:hypothetical protein